ncbi:PepSY domain-containing protein [Sporosarcina ureilytica]|uniref:PepSY domain-containing protein n=1 Tax=Sporosarcina ureilytica TaxID=298596 RepID=A0A1D8JJT1_9BACL|nr:PepSY domain-containing protein [Sporosarcina ureilytica]AOV08978.1 hypothetical protein BI350_16440 [Sporosarcina ureilytica]
MKVLKKQWLLPLLVTILLLVFGVIYIQGLFTNEEQMTKEEIQQQLEMMYEGTVGELTFQDGVYSTEITRPGGIYETKINAENGQVLSMSLINKIEVKEPELLSEQEVRDIVVKKYHNDIERLSHDDTGEIPVYNVEVAKDQALLKVVVDAKSGEVISEEKQPTTTKNTLITRERAIDIALKQLRGEVEFVEFHDRDDGGYYLVEIEQDNDDDDIEAIFQIHAITGKIMSVKWDD